MEVSVEPERSTPSRAATLGASSPPASKRRKILEFHTDRVSTETQTAAEESGIERFTQTPAVRNSEIAVQTGPVHIQHHPTAPTALPRTGGGEFQRISFKATR